MQTTFHIKRTAASDKEFQDLVACLDYELWVELKEDQKTYAQYNELPGIETAVVLYDGEEPVACGCFKEYDNQTIEIKRMFVQKAWRGKGLSKMVLNELENWAKEIGYRYSLLETSINFQAARRLYEATGYRIVPNYPPFVGLTASVCMKKELKG